MGTINAQTRQELRQEIGYRSGAMVLGTTTAAGTTTSFKDSELTGADKALNGKHFLQADGANAGISRIIEEYVGGDYRQGRFRTAMGSAVASGVQYELWDSDMPPARVNEFIHAAIRRVKRKAAPDDTNFETHTTSQLKQYNVASSVLGIRKVEYRSRVTHTIIDNCDSAWTESAHSSTTVSTDTEDKREGSASMKLVVDGTVANGNILVSQDVSTLDLSGRTHLEFWIKVKSTVAANDLAIILSTTANGGTETAKISIADQDGGSISGNGDWYYVRKLVNNPEDLTAIISVGLEYDANAKANTIWIDGMKMVRRHDERWDLVPRVYWNLDSDLHDIVFKPEALAFMGHSLLKLTGSKELEIPSNDGDLVLVDPDYVVNYAHSLIMRARADRNANSREAAHLEADRLMAIAERAKVAMQTPSGTRWFDET